MTICLYTVVVSPHQLPLARAIVDKIGASEFRYIYTETQDADHACLNFKLANESWILHIDEPEARVWLEESKALLCGLREFDLFERRAAKGLRNFYMSENWFKPPLGYLRILHPRYWGYVRKLVRLAKQGALRVLPIGTHAHAAFLRVGVPEVAMTIWGYFVAPSDQHGKHEAGPMRKDGVLRVLWVGRMLRLKRVGDIVRAVGRVCAACGGADDLWDNATGRRVARTWDGADSSERVEECCAAQLTLVGDGPERGWLTTLVSRLGLEGVVKFLPPVSLNEVRKLMREHDVYVLASNGYEGWGAVVSESIEEGMDVVGTFEAGSSATILPAENLYHCGDWNNLAKILTNRSYRHIEIAEWSAEAAARRLLAMVV